MHAAAAACLIWLPMSYIVWALVFYFFATPLVALIFHDWICHEYCKPRNPVMKFLLLMFFYLHDNNVKLKKNYHVFHHQMWGTPEKDPTYRKLKGVSFLRYAFGLQNNLDLGVPEREFSILEDLPWVRFMDRHSRTIYLASVVILFVVLPLEWFAVFGVLYPWLFFVLLSYHDYHLHGPVRNPDRAWMTVVFAHAAWHQYHHEHWRTEYYGPGLWRWINPAWYYRHLLFVTNNTSSSVPQQQKS